MRLNRVFRICLVLLVAVLVPAAVLAQTPTPTPTLPATPTALSQPSPTAPPSAPLPTATFVSVPPATYTSGPTGQSIRFDEVVAGVLNPQQRFLTYTFNGEAGEAVVLYFRSREAAPAITLSYTGYYGYPYPSTDQDGQISVYVMAVLPYSGEHAITIDDYANGGTASSRDFSFRLSRLSAQPLEGDPLISDQLSPDAPIKAYRMTAEQGMLLSVRVASASFSPQMVLVGPLPNGTELLNLTGPDYYTGGMAEMPLYRIPQSGDYLLLVKAFNSIATGPFELWANFAEVVPMAYGETLELPLEDGASDLYVAFQAREGDVIDVSAVAEGADPLIRLFAPDTLMIALDDDGGAGLTAELTRQTLTSRGMHVLYIHVIRSAADQVLTVTLQRASGTQLDEGAVGVYLDKNVYQSFTYEANAGDLLRFSADAVEGVTHIPTITIRQGDRVLAQLPGATVSRYSVEFRVPASGRVVVGVDGSGYLLSGIIELRLERVP